MDALGFGFILEMKMQFREIKRSKQALSEEECTAILKQEKRGVLSVIGDGGWPYGVPMNHFYNAEDGCLYFHSGRGGHKLDALQACDKACYTVIGPESPGREAWSLYVRSVIVFGRVQRIEDHEQIARICRALSYKFTDDETYIAEELRRSGPATALFRLVPEHMSGKLVHEA